MAAADEVDDAIAQILAIEQHEDDEDDDQRGGPERAEDGADEVFERLESAVGGIGAVGRGGHRNDRHRHGLGHLDRAVAPAGAGRLAFAHLLGERLAVRPERFVAADLFR